MADCYIFYFKLIIEIIFLSTIHL